MNQLLYQLNYAGGRKHCTGYGSGVAAPTHNMGSH